MKLSHKLSLAAMFMAITASVHGAVRDAQASPPENENKNVVVIMTDDQDMDSMPVMRKLLANPEGSWINFTNAFVNDSVCAPSRATLLTGQYSENHGVVVNNPSLFKPRDTLAVWLNDAGYNTAWLGKYHLQRGTRKSPPGWDVFNSKQLKDEVDGRTAMALDFLDDQTADTPFFLVVSYFAPHLPVKPPERYKNADVYMPPVRPNHNELDISDKPPWLRRFKLVPDFVVQKKRMQYMDKQRELLAVDDGIEAIIDTLKAQGLLDDTLVIFYSDNGHTYGSHRKYGKWCPYEECSRIPMYMRYPGATNREEQRFVSNVDLAATIVDYANVTPTLDLDGRSLMPLLDNTATLWRNSVLLERHPGDDYYGIRVPGWTYVEYNKGFRELYDLENDPWQMDNVANQPQYLAQQALLAQQLHELRNE